MWKAISKMTVFEKQLLTDLSLSFRWDKTKLEKYIIKQDVNN